MISAGAVPLDFPLGQGLRYEFGDWTLPPARVAPPLPQDPNPLEPFFSQPLAEYPDRAEPVSPSELGGSKALPSDVGLPKDVALSRGTYVHRILEIIADAPESEWEPLIASVSAPQEFTPDLADAGAREAQRARRSPELEWMFSPSALCEVAVTARICGTSVLGTIDRLIVTPQRVTAIDYKTNLAVPETSADCPEGILRQMGAYGAALEQIYPGREIATGILWTATAQYMPLSQSLVMDALLRSPHLDGALAAT